MSMGLSSIIGVSNALLSPKRAERDEEEGLFEQATVGVVICAYNEEQNIGPLLSALVKERVHEILVVASGCTDRTVEVARQFQAVHRRVRVLVEESRQGKTSAINLALKTISTKFIVFLPADVRPGEGSIAKLIEGFKPETGIRVGRPVPVDRESGSMGRLSHLIWTLHNRTLLELSLEGTLEHASGEFFAMRRGLVRELPLAVVNDDAYMAVEVRRVGFKIEYEDGAVAFMHGPGTIADYVSQRRRVHYGHVQVKKSTGHYPTVFEVQAVARPGFVLRILRLELKALRGGLRALMLGGTLEAVSLVLSGFDRVMGRSHVLWRMVESTKSLVPTLPMGVGSLSTMGVSSTRDVYLEQSLGRSWRSGLAHGRLSPRLEVAVLRPCTCY